MIDIEQHIWGLNSEGEPIVIYTMTNSHGEWIKITNQGAAVVGIGVRDRNGNIEDIALGYDDWQSYADSDDAAMGKTVGRVSGRITRGKFSINGKDFQLPLNQRPHHMNGGSVGFQNKLWQGRVEGNRVVFSYISPDSEGGYPGELGVETVYDWDDDSVMEISHYAATDSMSIVNISSNIYLNLNPSDSPSNAMEHTLALHNITKYAEVDSTFAPTGKLIDTHNTALDFSNPKSLAQNIDAAELANSSGYDHSFAVDGWNADGEIRQVATLCDERSGRQVDFITDQSAVHLYSGNYLLGSAMGKNGNSIEDHSGISISCMAMPDSINHANKPGFANIVIRNGQTYESHTLLCFSTF